MNSLMMPLFVMAAAAVGTPDATAAAAAADVDHAKAGVGIAATDVDEGNAVDDLAAADALATACRVDTEGAGSLQGGIGAGG